MFVSWGPALVNSYNNAYITMLGALHPHAFELAGAKHVGQHL